MKRRRNAPTLDGLVLRKSDVRRVQAWVKKFIRTIERAHKRAGRSTLVFKSQNAQNHDSSEAR